MKNVLKMSQYNQAKENAVHIALLEMGFQHVPQFRFYAMYDKAGFTTFSIPEGHAHSFEQVIKFLAAQTFTSSLPRDQKVLCGSLNVKMIQMAGEFEEQTGAAILERF